MTSTSSHYAGPGGRPASATSAWRAGKRSQAARLAAGGAAVAALALGGVQAAGAVPVTAVGCGATDLANAINSATSGETLSLQNGCTYDLTSGLTAAVSLNIQGNGDTIEPAAGSPAMTMLTFADSTTDSVSQLTMTHGNGGAPTGTFADDGGAIVNYGTLTITGSTFRDNRAIGGSRPSGSAGAILNIGTLSVDRSNFSGNDAATTAGGAIDTYGGPVTLTNSTFTDNQAVISGGALYSDNAVVTVTNCDFLHNSGDAIAMDGSSGRPLSVTGGEFIGNQATGPGAVGGAIESFVDTPTTVRHALFQDNSATAWGGAIYAYEDSPLTVSDSRFVHNTAGQYGGAIYTDDDSPLTLTGGVLTDNSAGKDGGGVAVFDGSTGAATSVKDATFLDNTVTAAGGWGGAIYIGVVVPNSSLSVNHSSFTGNGAPRGEGGAIWTDALTTKVSRSGFSRNYANSGGALFNQDSGGGAALTVTGSQVQENHAQVRGGGLDNGSGATLDLDHTQVTVNQAGTAGGGIYNAGTATLTSSPVFGNFPDNCAPHGSVPGC